MGPFATWLDAKQARRNDAVPEALRTPAARRLVRVADAMVGLTAAGGVGVCILLGIGVRAALPYAVAAAAVVTGLVVGAVAVLRVGRLETAAPPH